MEVVTLRFSWAEVVQWAPQGVDNCAALRLVVREERNGTGPAQYDAMLIANADGTDLRWYWPQPLGRFQTESVRVACEAAALLVLDARKSNGAKPPSVDFT